MKLVANGTSRVIAEDTQYEVGQCIRVPEPIQAEASPLFNEALPDLPLVVEWEVVAVDFTRNVAYAEPVLPAHNNQDHA